MARVLVTGAAGFIGGALCRALAERGHAVNGITRREAAPIAGVELCPVGEIGPQTDWMARLEGIDVAVHLAGRAHRPVDAAAAAREADAAAAFARAAISAGVGRLVYVSSIRAMGEATRPGMPFRPQDEPRPSDTYGRAKLAIERAMTAAARDGGIELVVLRPPLVYGPGVKGNFRALMRLVASGVPLPLSGLDNRRSLIFIDNLVDLLAAACTRPEAVGRALLGRDDTDVSTPELVRALAAGFGRRARLYALPAPLLAALGAAPGLGSSLSRLTSSLQLDDAETRDLLGWRPPVPSACGLAATAHAFIRRK